MHRITQVTQAEIKLIKLEWTPKNINNLIEIRNCGVKKNENVCKGWQHKIDVIYGNSDIETFEGNCKETYILYRLCGMELISDWFTDISRCDMNRYITKEAIAIFKNKYNVDKITDLKDISNMNSTFSRLDCAQYPTQGHKIEMYYGSSTEKDTETPCLKTKRLGDLLSPQSINDEKIELYTGSGDQVFLLYYLCRKDMPKDYIQYKSIMIFI